jgi:hypothetical protein
MPSPAAATGDFVSALPMIGLLLFSGPQGTRNLARQQSQCPTCGNRRMKPLAPRRTQSTVRDGLTF